MVEPVSIGGVVLDGRLALAPMAGVTDLAFRTVCREAGAALAYTEMVSAKALVFHDKKTASLLRQGENDAPLVAQIFGSDPETMAEAAPMACALSGCVLLDINMGCPTGKIVRNGDGSALMRDPARVRAIVSAVVRTSPVPVTVKIRKGWDRGSVNAPLIAKIAEDAGAVAVAVHGRTRAQLYSGTADWGCIAQVVEAVSIPVLANGDVFEAEDAPRILRRTGAAMAMIGRGSMGNPWLFTRANAALRGEPVPPLPPLRERCDVALRQFRLAARDKGEHIACLEARKHYAWYLRGVPYAGYYKRQIAQIESMADIERITEGIKRELR